MRVILLFDCDLETMLDKTWYYISARSSTIQDLASDITQFFNLDQVFLMKAEMALDPAALCFEVVRENDEVQVKRRQRVYGTRTVFLPCGSVETRPVQPWFEMPSPAEEYQLKRQQWKIKPIPKRKPF